MIYEPQDTQTLTQIDPVISWNEEAHNFKKMGKIWIQIERAENNIQLFLALKQLLHFCNCTKTKSDACCQIITNPRHPHRSIQKFSTTKLPDFLDFIFIDQLNLFHEKITVFQPSSPKTADETIISQLIIFFISLSS